jgi:hypothetical protein
MAATKKVTITVREGAVVYHDGRAYQVGEQIKVTAAEAKSLLEQGVAER